jgi:malate/lactate dehydrogenase
LGRKGLEKIIEVGLSNEEADALAVSAGKVREAIEALKI